MPMTCVGPWESVGGETKRGQETQSMPSAKDAFMSLTWMSRVSTPSLECFA